MNNPLVSIIIPTYNRASILNETLDSVLAQTYENWECIVVDDGSTDNTEDVIGVYITNDVRFRFVERDSKKVKGASSCRNTGLAISKGDYCLFLDSDDWLIENCLTQRVLFLQTNPNFDFIVVAMKVKKLGQHPVDKSIPVSEDYLKDFLAYKLYWQTMCTLWKKEFILKINGFNENYPRLNDPEVHIRGMLESKGNFYIAHELPADSIYRMEEVKSGKIFSEKYILSLKYFLKDIVEALDRNNRLLDKVYLKRYLIDYFSNFSYCIPLKQNFDLILISKKVTVINNKESILLLLWSFFKCYNFKVSNYINSKLGTFINKIIKIKE